MLTCLINDAPIFPEHEQLGSLTTAAAASSRVCICDPAFKSKTQSQTFEMKCFNLSVRKVVFCNNTFADDMSL